MPDQEATLGGLQARVESLLRPDILSLSAYHVPDSKGYVKLDAMENPYTWPDVMIADWLERLRRVEPNRYPDPVCASLRAALRRNGEVPDDAGLLLGNGSDEIIQMLLMALPSGATVISPSPTFVMYRQLSRALGLGFVAVPLGKDFSLDEAAMLAAIRTHQPAMVFLAYPNNPSGNLFDATVIRRIIAETPGLVVLDEAYAPYAAASFMSEVTATWNLLVMRTLSKLGLAGLRLGYLAGPRAWIEQFDKLRLPYNINVLTQVSAEFALERQDVLDAQVSRIVADRKIVFDGLAALAGVYPYESRANFVLFRLVGHDAAKVFDSLRDAGVLIKNLHPSGGALSQCLRVTVGTPTENSTFLQRLEQILARN